MEKFRFGPFLIVLIHPRQSFARHLHARRLDWKQNLTFENGLMWLAFVTLIIDMLVCLRFGMHTGFAEVQAASQYLHDDLWAHITFLGDTLTALCLFLFFAIRFPHLLFALLIASIVGVTITHTVKPLLDLPRPAGVLPLDQIHIIGSKLKSHSFPSGHTLTAFTVAGLLTRISRSMLVKIALLVMATLVGWSRVAVGAHWPADVLAGAAGGLFSAWAGFRLSDFWLHRFTVHVHHGILAVLVISGISLLGYDGHFKNTLYFSTLLGVSGLACLLYTLSCHSLLTRFKVVLQPAPISDSDPELR